MAVEVITEAPVAVEFDAADAQRATQAVDELIEVLRKLRPIWVHLSVEDRQTIVRAHPALRKLRNLATQILEDL